MCHVKYQNDRDSWDLDRLPNSDRHGGDRWPVTASVIAMAFTFYRWWFCSVRVSPISTCSKQVQSTGRSPCICPPLVWLCIGSHEYFWVHQPCLSVINYTQNMTPNGSVMETTREDGSPSWLMCGKIISVSPLTVSYTLWHDRMGYNDLFTEHRYPGRDSGHRCVSR
jgi:hypothetical protein